ncbi:MAG TPA: peptide deformylase [Bacteroidota bacterium]|jgi:peptide deformylase|nr:peptide deformylase [Bacteroidota bacterium]
MSVLPIYTYGATVLRKKAKPVTTVTDEIVKLIMDMYETMHAANGIGLAATQVGSLHRVIVIDISDLEETKDIKPLTLINPEVRSQDGAWVVEEGCLSIPNLRDEVERAEIIHVRYKDTNFKDVELDAAGLLGRVILHEIDHLNGVLFIDHLSEEKKKTHTEELKQIQRGEMEVSYPVVTATTVSA